MKKLALLILLFVLAGASAQAQNIVKSLERNVPGQGKVTMSSQVKVYFPELAVYTSFNPPRWLCRVGDFRSIEEADAMMRKMKATGVFKEVSIVKDEVNIPL